MLEFNNTVHCNININFKLKIIMENKNFVNGFQSWMRTILNSFLCTH